MVLRKGITAVALWFLLYAGCVALRSIRPRRIVDLIALFLCDTTALEHSVTHAETIHVTPR